LRFLKVAVPKLKFWENLYGIKIMLCSYKKTTMEGIECVLKGRLKMYKKFKNLKGFLSFFLFLAIITGPCFGQDRTDREDRVKRRQDSTTSRDSAVTYRENTTTNLTLTTRDETIVYQEELIKYLEYFSYYKFGESINGIYVIRLQNQEYINAHIIIDNSPELNIASILGNIAIGGAVIVTAIVLPMLAPKLPSLVAIIVTNINAAHVVQASLVSATIAASISGINAYVKSGGDPRETFNRAIEKVRQMDSNGGLCWLMVRNCLLL
jgi:hypothetical protein